MGAYVDEDYLFLIYWADCFDQIHSVRPDFKRVDKGFELLLESLVLDPEESCVDSAEEHEDASTQRDSDSYRRKSLTEDKD